MSITRSAGEQTTARYVPVPADAPRADEHAFVPTAVPSPRPCTGEPVRSVTPDLPVLPPGAGSVRRPTAAPPRRRGRLLLWAAGGLVVGLLGVLVMLVVVGWPPGSALRGSAGEPGPAVPAAVGPGAPGVAPVVPTGRLAAAFPDVAALGDRCTPYRPGAEQYVTSTGARPVAVVLCDYGAAVPGGFVYYTEWSTPADARQWHDDQRGWGPSLDGLTEWGHGPDQRQGPLHRRVAPDGTVYATAAYAERPYTFDIVTRSTEDSNRMFPAMHLLPAAQLPS
ncbi:hypothetical protein [Actinomycetospora aeridis]|uniref:DUF4185 domain-containing protein n=1 Tax=Actinomycetospora aeridis TaxID=3129231 RepID=A0ABU8N642_9PSEU